MPKPLSYPIDHVALAFARDNLVMLAEEAMLNRRGPFTEELNEILGVALTLGRPATTAHEILHQALLEHVTEERSGIELPDLSGAQARVMSWVGKGWSAIPYSGSAYQVNGEKICNNDTLTVLERLLLVHRGEHGCFYSTAYGRAATKALGL